MTKLFSFFLGALLALGMSAPASAGSVGVSFTGSFASFDTRGPELLDVTESITLGPSVYFTHGNARIAAGVHFQQSFILFNDFYLSDATRGKKTVNQRLLGFVALRHATGPFTLSGRYQYGLDLLKDSGSLFDPVAYESDLWDYDKGMDIQDADFRLALRTGTPFSPFIWGQWIRYSLVWESWYFNSINEITAYDHSHVSQVFFGGFGVDFAKSVPATDIPLTIAGSAGRRVSKDYLWSYSADRSRNKQNPYERILYGDGALHMTVLHISISSVITLDFLSFRDRVAVFRPEIAGSYYYHNGDDDEFRSRYHVTSRLRIDL